MLTLNWDKSSNSSGVNAGISSEKNKTHNWSFDYGREHHHGFPFRKKMDRMRMISQEDLSWKRHRPWHSPCPLTGKMHPYIQQIWIYSMLTISMKKMLYIYPSSSRSFLFIDIRYTYIHSHMSLCHALSRPTTYTYQLKHVKTTVCAHGHIPT